MDFAAETEVRPRERPGLPQQAADLGDLGSPSHEAGELHRQVVGHGIKRAQRRELGAQIGMADLEDVLGAGEVSQAMRAQVYESRSPRRMIYH